MRQIRYAGRLLMNVAALTALTYITGCEGVGSLGASNKSKRTTESALILRDQCVLRTPPEETIPLTPIVLAAAPELIDLVFKVGTHFLQSDPADFEATDGASTAADGFYLTTNAKADDETRQYTLAYGCLIFVRGRFSSTPGDLNQHVDADFTEDWTKDALNSLSLIARPELYIETAVQVVFAGNKQRPVMRLEPIFFDYQETKAKKSGDGTKKINLIVEFSTPNLDQTTDLATSQFVFAKTSIPIGERQMGGEPISVGTDTSQRMIATSDWLPLPRPNVEDLPDDDGEPFYPFSVVMTVEEAGERSKLRETVETGGTELLNALKKPITDAVTKALNDALQDDKNSGGSN